MAQRWPSFELQVKAIETRETEEVAEAMVEAAGDQVLFVESKALLQSGRDRVWQSLVIEKAGWRTCVALCEGLSDNVDQIARVLIVDIQLRVSRHLDRVRFSGIVQGEDLIQIHADDVVQEHHMAMCGIPVYVHESGKMF